jgi:hypothetical protein
VRKLVVVGALAIAAVALVAGGCGSDTVEGAGGSSGGSCVDAKVAAFADGVDAFEASLGDLRQKMAAACAAIATDLGENPPIVGPDPSEQVLTDACQLAQAAIEAEITAGATLVVSMSEGLCDADTDAQTACEVGFGCEGPAIDARCPVASIVATCPGSCDGVCRTGADAAACAGACTGSCTGTCDAGCHGTCDGAPVDGMCAGTCEGVCDGNCAGTCAGDCVFAGSVMCSGDCDGGCDVQANATACEEALDDPGCGIDSLCIDLCAARAEAGGRCERGGVGAYSSGGDPALGPTLATNFGGVALCISSGRMYLDAAEKLGEAAVGLSAPPSCSDTFADLTTRLGDATESLSTMFDLCTAAFATVDP